MSTRTGTKTQTLALALALTLTSPIAADGDTVQSGKVWVRLVQVNTPEKGECYYEEAKRYTEKFLKLNGKLILTGDERLDSFDQYGRRLGYLTKGNRNLNLELIKYGYAKPYFYNGVRGKYAQQIDNYARQAKTKRLGVWNCKTGE